MDSRGTLRSGFPVPVVLRSVFLPAAAGGRNIFHVWIKNLLTNFWICYILSKSAENSRNGSLAQLGEHLPYKQRVIGSSPIIPTIYAGVAQLVEHCLAKAVVAGPSPVSRSI